MVWTQSFCGDRRGACASGLMPPAYGLSRRPKPKAQRRKKTRVLCVCMPDKTPVELGRENTMSEKSHWMHVHEQLKGLAARRANIDAEEGPWLLAAWRNDVAERLGYGSFQEYIGSLFGYSSRWVRERLRVARALEGLSELHAALRKGELHWSAVREVTRVATTETEQAWLDTARNKSTHELEQLVSGRPLGASPGDPKDASVTSHVLRLEVSAETYATYREAIMALQRSCGEPIDDDGAMLLMARSVLEGPKDSGRSGYQIAISVCESCGQGFQHGRGEAVAVDASVVEMAACDAQIFSVTARSDTENNATAEDAAQSPGLGGLLWSKRAKQSTPPATRRAVMQRDGGKCVVGSCRNATFVDVHHVLPRNDGGSHDPEYLAVLCGVHHRSTHRGTLIIEGRASTGFRFFHADGTPYGGVVNPAQAEANKEAFLALRQLGFGETAVKAALTTVRAEAGGDTESKPGKIARAALTKLSRSAQVSYTVPPTLATGEVRERPRSLRHPPGATHVGHAGGATG